MNPIAGPPANSAPCCPARHTLLPHPPHHNQLDRRIQLLPLYLPHLDLQDPEVDACAWFSGNMTLVAQPKKVRRGGGVINRGNDVVMAITAPRP